MKKNIFEHLLKYFLKVFFTILDLFVISSTNNNYHNILLFCFLQIHNLIY
jgi:hypothetical protein